MFLCPGSAMEPTTAKMAATKGTVNIAVCAGFSELQSHDNDSRKIKITHAERIIFYSTWVNSHYLCDLKYYFHTGLHSAVN